MLDVYNLPGSNSGDEQIFIGTVGAGTYLDFHTWQKPRGCSMVHILAVGGGGGGGGGAQTVALIPAKLLPDTLYMFEGAFSASTPALIIGVQPPSTTTYSSKDSIIIILAYGGKSATGGGTGGNGGAAMASSGTYDGKFHGLGIMDSVAGQDGQNGSGGTMYLPTTGTRATAGTGGGSTGSYSIRAKSGGGGIYPDTLAGGNYTVNNTSGLPFMSYGGIWDLNNYPQDGGIGAGGCGQDVGGGRNPGLGGPGFVMIAAW